MRLRLLCLQLCQMGLVTVKNCLLQNVPRLRRDGVGNIAEGAVFIFAAGHGDKQPLRALYDLDIVYGKVAVDGDRDQRLQPCVLVNFADPDIGDVHSCFSFRVLPVFCWAVLPPLSLALSVRRQNMHRLPLFMRFW